MAHATHAGLSRENRAFLSDTVAAETERGSRGATRLLAVTTLLLAAFLGWSSIARLDEVTRGEGQLIPSSRRQVVSSLEGGIVKQIRVREGDQVEAGATLLVLDDTGFSASLGELDAKALALRTQIARLAAEARGEPLAFDPMLEGAAAPLIASERRLYEIRAANLANQTAILEERLSQRRQERAELGANRDRLVRSLELARDEQTLKAPMARAGVVRRTDMLTIDRAVAELEGELKVTDDAIPRVEAAIREAERMVADQMQTFARDAQVELNARRAELMIIDQSLTAARDRVVRTEIRSPVGGIVNSLHVNTVGGIVKAGEPTVEITPVEEALLVQARVRPQDIAFVHPGQKALVKLTAYDFSIYGGLDGAVEIISSDSMTDERAREPYYLVTVRTKGMALEKGGRTLPIIPGMVATVDILTGEKTVLDYLLKPINKARHEALRER